MIGSHLVLIVDADVAELRRTVKVFEAAGFVVMSASSFAQAKGLLAAVTPDLVIADIKLGAFNGLHLAAICAVSQPRVAFIATHSTYDHVLDTDAKRLSASYVVKTPARVELTLTAMTLLDSPLHGSAGVRRTFRKAVPGQTHVKVAASDAEVVDVSYDGMQLKLTPDPSPPAEDAPPVAFEIVFPHLDLSLHATRVWASPDSHSGGWLCGAALSRNDSPQLERWRDFVNSVA
jgi:DNA-binding response OmpR family regulator